jgi:hypothetical protein
VSKPHLRREKVLDGPDGPVYVWACKTLDRTGYGMHWRTAWDAWRGYVHAPTAGLAPLPSLAFEPKYHAYTDMTLQ